MLATHVAAPVIERLASGTIPGGVLGGSDDVAYLSLDGFVVAVTGPGVPLMPNGVAVGEPPLPLAAGDDVEAGRGLLSFSGRTVRWDPAYVPVWNPRPVLSVATPEDVNRLGAGLLGALGISASSSPGALASGFAIAGVPLARDREGRAAIARLYEAVAGRDPVAAKRAGTKLAGRGGGLTPEGDDFLTACALAVALFGPLIPDFPALRRHQWLEGLRLAVPPEVTTSLSRTLVDLACSGEVAEPLHSLLEAAPHSPEWDAALADLRHVGSTTGLVYAVGVGAAALVLTDDTTPPPGTAAA
jgi:hypothetical protein